LDFWISVAAGIFAKFHSNATTAFDIQLGRCIGTQLLPLQLARPVFFNSGEYNGLNKDSRWIPSAFALQLKAQIAMKIC
jgi:hypothetical protein